MKHYYLVPVTCRGIQVNHSSLFDTLKIINEELYLREKLRVTLTYELNYSSQLKEIGYIDTFNQTTSEMYREYRVPEKIICVSDKNKVFEIANQLPVSAVNSSLLEVFRVSPEKAVDYLEESGYSDKVERFFDEASKKYKQFRK